MYQDNTSYASKDIFLLCLNHLSVCFSRNVMLKNELFSCTKTANCGYFYEEINVKTIRYFNRELLADT